MGVYSQPDRPTIRNQDPELAALQAELEELYRLEHKENIKQEVARLRQKYGSAGEPTIEQHMRLFWEAKGIGVVDVRKHRCN